jgi:hypothetical protein
MYKRAWKMEDVYLIFSVLPLLTSGLSTCTTLPEIIIIIIIIIISNLLQPLGKYTRNVFLCMKKDVCMYVSVVWLG